MRIFYTYRNVFSTTSTTTVTLFDGIHNDYLYASTGVAFNVFYFDGLVKYKLVVSLGTGGSWALYLQNYSGQIVLDLESSSVYSGNAIINSEVYVWSGDTFLLQGANVSIYFSFALIPDEEAFTR